jgi:hypothetical protein
VAAPRATRAASTFRAARPYRRRLLGADLGLEGARQGVDLVGRRPVHARREARSLERLDLAAQVVVDHHRHGVDVTLARQGRKAPWRS